MIYNILAFFITISLFQSCVVFESKNEKIEDINVEYSPSKQYIPFKESEEGKWGMIGTDGRPLFREKFEEEITVVKEGRFFAKDTAGNCRLYTAEASPKQRGSSYISVSMFCNGVAAVVRKGMPIEFIDVDGKVLFTFDKVNNKQVLGMSNFHNGVASFETLDHYWGVVDTKGKVIIEPRYTSAIVAGDRLVVSEEPKKWVIYTLTGEKKGSFQENKSIKGSFEGRLRIDDFDFVNDKSVLFKNSRDSIGIISDKGSWVVKPLSGNKKVVSSQGEKIIYRDDKGNYGLMDYDGSITIRAVYDNLSFSGVDGVLIAEKDTSCFLINGENNRIIEDEFDQISHFLKDSVVLTKIIKNKCVMHNGVSCIHSLMFNEGEHFVESDYVDFYDFVKDLKITNHGIGGLSLIQSPLENLDVCINTGSHYKEDALKHTSRIVLSYDVECKYGVSCLVFANYNSPIADAQTMYTMKSYGGKPHKKYDKTICTFNENLPEGITMQISYGKLRGKYGDLLKVLKAEYVKLGLEIVEESECMLLGKLGNYGVYIESDSDNDIRIVLRYRYDHNKSKYKYSRYDGYDDEEYDDEEYDDEEYDDEYYKYNKYNKYYKYNKYNKYNKYYK